MEFVVVVFGIIIIFQLSGVKRLLTNIQNSLFDIHTDMAKDQQKAWEDKWRQEDPESFADYETSNYLNKS